MTRQLANRNCLLGGLLDIPYPFFQQFGTLVTRVAAVHGVGRGLPTVVVAVRNVGLNYYRKADVVAGYPSRDDLARIIRAAISAVQVAVCTSILALDSVALLFEREGDFVQRVAPSAGEGAGRRDARGSRPETSHIGFLRAGRSGTNMNCNQGEKKNHQR